MTAAGRKKSDGYERPRNDSLLTSSGGRQQLALELLGLLNRPAEKTDIIHEILVTVKKYTGFEAVGIRIRDGDDFPYYTVNGFSDDFVSKEKNLCMYDDRGAPLRGPDGLPVLECMCGTVIRGMVSRERDYISGGGSFWTNSTTELLASAKPGDFQTNIRGRCNTEGYESVALIPLRSGAEITGLLQLNDSRPGMFSADVVCFFEGIGSSIGIALKRRLSEEELAETNRLMESILDNTHILAALMDADFNFIKVNRAYAEKNGRDQSFFPGKNHFDLYPDSDNVRIFREVAGTGNPYIVYAKPFVHPGSPERGVTYWDWSLVPVKDAAGAVTALVLTLADVTARIQMEKELDLFHKQLESMVTERTAELEDANRQLINETADRVMAEIEKKAADLELEQIFNTILLGIKIVDVECRVVKVNKRFLEMFQLSADDIVNEKCHTLWEGQRCDTPGCPVEMILAGSPFVEFETKRSLPSGGEIICSVNSVPYYSCDGVINGIIQYYIDVTEKKIIEREVLRISEEERQRIGNDLHDIIGQNLTAIAFLVEALGQKMSEGRYGDASQSIEQIGTLIRSAVSQTRKITRILRPVEMEKRGLRSALEGMAASISGLFNVSCGISGKGDFIIDDIEDATNLFYIAREAVNNSIKHGKPGNIIIQLNADERELVMTISDDGKVPDAGKSEPGMGLKIMRYRANMIGAEFNAGSREQGGYQVEVRIRKKTAS